MKDRGILHPRLARVIASMGHGDALCITDAGLPIPTGSLRIDLAYAPGQPAFLDVLDAVLSELRLERYTMATESSPPYRRRSRMRLRSAAESSVSHQELKEITAEAKAVVRTGEFSPYANVILYQRRRLHAQ